MNNFFNNKKLITLLVSLIFFIAILWFSFSNLGMAPGYQQIVNDVTAVAGRVFSKPVNAMNSFFSDINHLLNTYEENQRLKAELDTFVQVQSDLSTIEEENKKLTAELNLQETLTEYSLISGTVIARNPDQWIDQIIIDRGSTDGLVNGMSVLSNNGLIGRVTEVSPTSSKVTLLTTSDEAAILTSAEILLEDETIFGVVKGYDIRQDALVMEQITSTSTIELETRVITSGLGGLVPRGLLIGTVKQVTLDRHGLGQRVYIEPATDFKDIRFVTIINREAEMITDFEIESNEESE